MGSDHRGIVNVAVNAFWNSSGLTLSDLIYRGSGCPPVVVVTTWITGFFLPSGRAAWKCGGSTGFTYQSSALWSCLPVKMPDKSCSTFKIDQLLISRNLIVSLGLWVLQYFTISGILQSTNHIPAKEPEDAKIIWSKSVGSMPASTSAAIIPILDEARYSPGSTMRIRVHSGHNVWFFIPWSTLLSIDIFGFSASFSIFFNDMIIQYHILT